ncbi:MAG: glycoside hydrolase family protein, partial [Bacteroidota bacterium]
SKDRDASSYSVYRSDVDGRNRRLIANKIRKTNYLDYVPAKGEGNTYMVYAHDYSGNVSTDFAKTEAKLEIIKGTSFSDLILPMPIHRELTSETWGTEGVLPRDIDNGIEHPEWSYWGGRPVYDKTDGKYHMLVVRWPANAIKGHWEWPNSTVSQTISDTPTGPYEVVNDLAYDYLNGHGHNADVTLLNDGSYLLYIVRKGESHLLKSNTMKGPWKPLGKMVVDWKATNEDPRYTYKYYNNLSGVQLEDGRLLFVTKAGEMIISKGPDPLGPYQVITEQMKGNPIIPEQYRKSVYEDPVLWKDEVQYHMLINAFLDKRCIYLRSPDGIHWKFNPGTAYTPNNTSYEDGTQTNWYKLERPHVLTDPYGRATHLSLAVIDVPKRDDLAGDRHNSKNLILPLVVHKRLKMLNKTPVTAKTKKITVRVISEKGFDAQKDLDIESLRFGASEEVDHGRGCRVVNTRKKDGDLILTFDGERNGITEDHFVCKLLGKTTTGDLVIGYSKLKAD